MNYAIVTNNAVSRILGGENYAFSPDVYQPAKTLSAEQKAMFGVLPVVDIPPVYDSDIADQGAVSYAITSTEVTRTWAITPKTQAEIDAIAAAKAKLAGRAQLVLDAKADAGFTTLETATLAQINTFINLHFASTDAAGRSLLKLLAATASAYLREH